MTLQCQAMMLHIRKDSCMPDRPLPPMNPYPPPAPDKMPADRAVPQGKELFYFVLDCMEDDTSRREIEDELVDLGYSINDAAMIVADVADRRRHFLRAKEEEVR